MLNLNNISLITSFKKFRGVFNTLQKSALYSWQANNLPVVTSANEDDTREVCSGYSNITILDRIKGGLDLGFNTQAPVLPDLIRKALPVIKTPMVGIINGDIILLEDFSEKCAQIFEKYGYDVFIAGSRFDIRLNYCVKDKETYKQIQQEKRSIYNPLTSSDLIITSKFLWRKILKDMPEFIMGRHSFYNWLHSYAEVNEFRCFNCTNSLISLHGSHNYDNLKILEGAIGMNAPSAQYNLKLFNPLKSLCGVVQIKYWQQLAL